MIYEQMFYGGIAGALLFLVLSLFCFRSSGFFQLSSFKKEQRRPKRQSRKQETEVLDNQKVEESKKTEPLSNWRFEQSKATEVLDSRDGMQEFLVEFREICVHTEESIGG